MFIYEEAYFLCTAVPKALSDKLYYSLEEFFRQTCEDACKEIMAGNLTSVYHAKWQVYSIGSNIIRSQCRYLESTWIKDEKDKYRQHMYSSQSGSDSRRDCPSDLGPLAFQQWKTYVFEKVQERMIKDLLQDIQKDRDGEMINASEVQGVISSLVELDSTFKAPEIRSRHGYQQPGTGQLSVYQETFEKQFLAETAQFYQRESNVYLSENNCSDYMKKAEARLQEEEIRARKLIHSSSFAKHSRECEYQLVSAHMDMLKGECQSYMKNEDVDDLSRMYRLLRRVPEGVDVLLREFETYVTAVGREQIAAIQEMEPRSYVECLLAVHARYHQLVQNALQTDDVFVAGLDKACRSIVNHTMGAKIPQAPELLAKYCDMLLKRSPANKHVDEAEIMQKLMSVMTLFKYVDDKDVFQKFYSRMLAKRLIHSQSVSEEAEEKMIDNLKNECGFEYTMKLQRMYTDVALSATVNQEFSAYVAQKNIVMDLDFSSFVLQSAAWPLNAVDTDFDLPGPMERAVQHFETFYHEKHNGRKLQWMHHVSKVDIKLKYLKKRYEVQATSYQASVLLMFNERDTYSFAEIQEETQLNASELTRTLDSLVKTRLLLHATDNNTSAYELNTGFASNRTKFKITQAVQAEPAKEAKEAYGAVQEHRVFYLQATIVRIMKARKLLGHTDLVQEVVVQSSRHGKFTASIPQVKKCIEQLIDKEYLERTGPNKDKYSYVA
ncbi:hypothetical protein SARC_08090 [Sphaeroforma arctica JP610]|uniref:Cullin-5 n=1 Tax=Sphaeroforma arctica JP610 TaxID=667725 RepID=A0A0L0FUC0_9EUKA|nr:hypothetical protein, variant [Sphaeroforma arctica JP610]XP_014153425.1 hypothetical protein SARC_08090 [Sphaeroforma arctica JP610]KNC79522.1 hypothetical protein, variant [Sphaeroforma arctica JP610]KNC79523.1 hypothetical protein SARC_08090 [Sphaeroforma arctica JP610]|eukprot:XP_014153424.1 hypothetical protein, variant [Sphaeroforma arctica JP610]